MKLVSLTICRNSAWSIGPVIRHALKYCDSAVVLTHACTDQTLNILRRFDDRVTIMQTVDEEWDEMHHRQMTLNYGREIGGTHFLILDDDEMLTNNLVPHIRERAERLQPKQIMRQPMRCCWRSLDQYRSDCGNPFSQCWKSVIFADAPDLYWEDEDGYQHHHTHPYNSVEARWDAPQGGGWLHFQHANWRRLVAKQTWYMCMELCRYGVIRANYHGTMDETGLQTTPVPPEWWSPLRDKIKLTAEPWQVRDIRRMVTERGEDFFTRNGVRTASVLKEWNV